MLPTPTGPEEHNRAGLSLTLRVSPEGTILDAGGSVPDLAGAIGQPLAQTSWFRGSPSLVEALRVAIDEARRSGPRLVQSLIDVAGRGAVAVEISIAWLTGASGQPSVSLHAAEPKTADTVGEALRESERTLANLMSCWSGFAFRCKNDADYTTVYASEGSREITGYPPEALLAGKPSYGSLIHPDDADDVWRKTQAALDGRERYQVQYRITDGRGAERWIWEQGQGVYDRNDELQFIEGFCSDITDLRQAQEALRRAARLQAVGKMAGGIAHDFNNILAALMGTMDYFARAAPQLRAEADEMLDLCRHGASLTRRLLAFSKSQVVERQVLDIGALVTALEPMLRRALPPNITTEVDASPAHANVDRTQLEQVVLNLCFNARDAMPDGGALRVGVAVVGDSVELVVEDTGIGMSEDTVAQIFDPFFTTRADGTGIGLGIVHEIVTQSRGTVDVESHLGDGTRFRIRLPVAREVEPRPPIPLHPPPEGPAKVALLVDDDRGVRRIVQILLEDMGCDVKAADSAAAALAILDTGAPVDVLLTDVVMPGGGGYDLAQRARATHPDIKVIYISGYAPDPRVQHSVDSGEATFLAKPFGRDALESKLRQAFDEPAARASGRA